MRQFVLILLLLLSTVSFSQKFVQLQVLDKTENFPLPGAHNILVQNSLIPNRYAHRATENFLFYLTPVAEQIFAKN